MTDVLTNIEQYLHEHLDDSRLQHSRNTAKVAVELARKYGADEHKALVAGLLHDVAKGVCQNGMLNVAEQYHVDADEVEKANPELLHGKLGAAMVKTDLGISDDEILSAIRWHTTGRANMSLLEKIIYLADLIEPSRSLQTSTRYAACIPDIETCSSPKSRCICYGQGFTRTNSGSTISRIQGGTEKLEYWF